MTTVDDVEERRLAWMGDRQWSPARSDTSTGLPCRAPTQQTISTQSFTHPSVCRPIVIGRILQNSTRISGRSQIGLKGGEMNPPPSPRLSVKNCHSSKLLLVALTSVGLLPPLMHIDVERSSKLLVPAAPADSRSTRRMWPFNHSVVMLFASACFL